MKVFNLTEQRKEWVHPPVGGENTHFSALDELTNSQIREWVWNRWPVHYSQESNYLGRYREMLGLDTTRKSRILDYGCGFGFDALSYAINQNEVAIADIVPGNLRAATRIFLACEKTPSEIINIQDCWPYFTCRPFDVFHASGVLHHTPMIREILQRAVTLLNPNGQIRLMLYTDYLWKVATGVDAPTKKQGWLAFQNEHYQAYLRYCDAVGGYVDWYSQEKLVYYTEDFLTLRLWEYLRPDNGYAVAILTKRE